LIVSDLRRSDFCPKGIEAEANALIRGSLSTFKNKEERKQKNSDQMYQRLLEDNYSAFKTTLRNFSRLHLCAWVISIDNQIKAITIGYPLSRETFVVAFEVCDLSCKGIAQYIFQSLCQERSEPYINIMDDSGLENLKRVKTSYKPYKKEKSFVAYSHA